MPRLILRRLGCGAAALYASCFVASADIVWMPQHPPLPPKRPAGLSPPGPLGREAEAAQTAPVLVSKAEADYAEPAYADSDPGQAFFIRHPPVPPKKPAAFCAPAFAAAGPEAAAAVETAAEASHAAAADRSLPLRSATHSSPYDGMIADLAAQHGVPESFIHRIIVRESRYNPRAFHNHCFGLLQLKYGTAQNMGYHGAPEGLFDPKINLIYGTPYIANAYRLAGGDERRAISLYAGGYYYYAKRLNRLAELQTAASKPGPAQVMSPRLTQASYEDPGAAPALRPAVSEVSYR